MAGFKSLFLLSILLGPFSAKALVILQYHHISDQTPAITSTSPALFKKHLARIDESGFNVVKLEEVAALIRQRKPLPDRAVLITFDDAYLSVYTQAFPLLKKRGWPFTLFVSTQPVDDKWQEFLSWEQIREMAANGGAIANHTVSHSHMAKVPSDGANWQHTMLHEIEYAEQRIKEETGQSLKVFSYPYGEFNAPLRGLLARQGYLAMGQHSGAVMAEQRTDIPRFPMGGLYGHEKGFITKLQTKPFTAFELLMLSKLGEPLQDGVLTQSQWPPQLTFSFSQKDLAGRFNCFFSAKGEVKREPVAPLKVSITLDAHFPMGRSRLNCTAPSAEKGRFYWYSLPFVRFD